MVSLLRFALQGVLLVVACSAQQFQQPGGWQMDYNGMNGMNGMNGNNGMNVNPNQVVMGNGPFYGNGGSFNQLAAGNLISPGGNQVGVGCTAREAQVVFRTCAYNFALAHQNVLPLFRQSPVCQAGLFDCEAVEDFIKCLNKLPKSVVSDQCWVTIPYGMPQRLQQLGIPCNYQDITRTCRGLPRPKQPSERKTGLEPPSPWRQWWQRVRGSGSLTPNGVGGLLTGFLG